MLLKYEFINKVMIRFRTIFLKISDIEWHLYIIYIVFAGERPYKCTLCNRAFNQKGALRIHMSKHTGDKPFMCDFCPHVFAQKGNLRAHIKVRC